MDSRTIYIIIVSTSALIAAVESVAVEAAINSLELGIFVVTAVPTILGGIILIGIVPGQTSSIAKEFKRSNWLYIGLMCVFIALGIYLWYDAISRIGAGKEALLGGGSSEVLFVVILSAIFLRERLSRWEYFGIFLILSGVIIVLINTNTVSLTIGLGEIEAIVSSLLLATSVIMVTRLLRIFSLTPISALELIISGLMLFVLGIALGLISFPDIYGWLLLIGLGIFPAIGILTYNAGLPKIGPSITSVLFALTGIITVCVQLLILFLVPEAELILPQNVYLAVTGGLIAFVGVYILKLNPGAKKEPAEAL